MDSPNLGLTLWKILVATIQDASFWAGLVTVLAFSQGRFSEKQADEEDPPLPARYFTSRFRYYGSAVLYSGVFIAVYCVLIIVGSVPAFQVVLVDLFGSLKFPATSLAQPGATSKAEIGSPAWAAMLIMVIAPTVPWIRRRESSFRLWLQEFSDIPFKARQLSAETIVALSGSKISLGRVEDADEVDLCNLFDQLERLERELVRSNRPKLDEAYRRFFLEHGELLNKTKAKFSAIRNEFDTFRSVTKPLQFTRKPRSVDQAEGERPELLSYRQQMALVAQRYARLLICAMLWIEGEEYNVRQTLRKVADTSISVSPFRFTKGQVFLGLVLVTISTLILGPVVAVIVDLIRGAAISPRLLIGYIGDWAIWGIAFSFAFILPLSLAAAVRLYLIDRRVHRGGPPDTGLLAVTLVLTFLGCLGLASLVTVAVSALVITVLPPPVEQPQGLDLLLAILRAIPPAAVNTAFVMVAGMRLSEPGRRNALVDFLLFAAIGGGTALFIYAIHSLALAGNFRELIQSFWQNRTATTLTTCVVSGLFGVLQCSMSRRFEKSVPKTLVLLRPQDLEKRNKRA